MALLQTYIEAAKRICDSSNQICDRFSNRIQIDPSILTKLEDFRCIPNNTAFTADSERPQRSLSVEEQIAHFAKLDEIEASINNWARSVTPGAKSKKSNALGSKSIAISRENLSASSDDLSCAITAESSEDVLTVDDIRNFNNQHYGGMSASSTDVQRICEQDKQTLRPIFKHVPRMKEFIGQLETEVDLKKLARDEVDDSPRLTDLLKRLYELIVDVTYLEDHIDLYDPKDIEAYDDPIQKCLEQLHTQIMNQNL